jgi:hypothetical protein
MAYDPVIQRVVLHGGRGVNTYWADTWELDGTKWVERTLASTPPPRNAAAMTYDEASKRHVLFAGTTGLVLDDAWTLERVAQVATEACGSSLDYDGDGAIGCMDVDCATVCTGCNDGKRCVNPT